MDLKSPIYIYNLFIESALPYIRCLNRFISVDSLRESQDYLTQRKVYYLLHLIHYEEFQLKQLASFEKSTHPYSKMCT
jgi:hypothetical protein